MPEQPPIPAAQDEKASTLKNWGYRCVAIGLVLQVSIWLLMFLQLPNTRGILDLIFLFSLIIGIPLCGLGLILLAKGKGQSSILCIFALVPILGPLLGLLSISLIDGVQEKRRRVRASFIVGVLALAGLVVLVAIAIPNFMTYGAKARQSEAKVGLGGIFTTATSYFKENGTYEVSNIKNLGYAPSGTPRYTFWYAVKGVPTRINVVGLHYAAGCDGPPSIVKVAASATGFTAAARGNMDADDTCDEWSINDAKVLTNTINDVVK